MLRGLTHNNRDQLVVIDLTPFDGCLPTACVELNAAANPSRPSLSCISVSWAGSASNKRQLTQFVDRRVRDRVAVLIKDGTLKLPGVPDLASDLGQPMLKKPQLDEGKFEITAPMSDGTLRFHQQVLDVWTGKPEFKDLVAEHN